MEFAFSVESCGSCLNFKVGKTSTFKASQGRRTEGKTWVSSTYHCFTMVFSCKYLFLELYTKATNNVAKNFWSYERNCWNSVVNWGVFLKQNILKPSPRLQRKSARLIFVTGFANGKSLQFVVQSGYITFGHLIQVLWKFKLKLANGNNT